MFDFKGHIDKAKAIIEGHTKELMNENTNLRDKRINICKNCPLYIETSVGPKCNPVLFMNLATEITYTSAMPNTIQGCGCRLNAKTRLEDEHCPANKW